MTQCETHNKKRTHNYISIKIKLVFSTRLLQTNKRLPVTETHSHGYLMVIRNISIITMNWLTHTKYKMTTIIHQLSFTQFISVKCKPRKEKIAGKTWKVNSSRFLIIHRSFILSLHPFPNIWIYFEDSITSFISCFFFLVLIVR